MTAITSYGPTPCLGTIGRVITLVVKLLVFVPLEVDLAADLLARLGLENIGNLLNGAAALSLLRGGRAEALLLLLRWGNLTGPTL